MDDGRNVNFEFGTLGVNFGFDEDESCVRGLSHKPGPTNPSADWFHDTKKYPPRGWLGLACETAQEATTSTKTFGRPVLENSYYANARMVIVLIRLLWCQASTLGSSVFDERYWLCFSVGRASAFYTLFCSLPQPSHAGQLEKGDHVYQGHCQWDASCKKEP